MLRRYRHLARSEEGFTLIEVLVVMLLIATISMITLSLVISLFDSQIRSSQYLDQQTTIEHYYGYMASRLAVAQSGDIGLRLCKPQNGKTAAEVCDTPATLDGNPAIYRECVSVNADCREVVDPVSMAGDQLVFLSQGVWYRIFYVRDSDPDQDGDQGQIRGAMGADSTDIDPVRGPNELEPGEHPDPGDPNYDAVLDDPAKSFVLAEPLASERPNLTAPNSAPAQMIEFGYLGGDDRPYPYAGSSDSSGQYASGSDNPYTNDNCTRSPSSGEMRVCPSARMSQRNGAGAITDFYEISSQWDAQKDIKSIDATSYIAPRAGQGTARVPDRYYQQNFSLNQICRIDPDDAADSPGTVLAAGRQNNTSGGLDAHGITSNNEAVELSSGTALESNARPLSEAWLRFNGAVRIHGGDADSYISVQLYRRSGGGWSVATDALGLSELRFYFPSDDASVPLNGAFKLSASMTPGDYKIQVRVKDANGAQYDRSSATFLTYEWVAD